MCGHCPPRQRPNDLPGFFVAFTDSEGDRINVAAMKARGLRAETVAEAADYARRAYIRTDRAKPRVYYGPRRSDRRAS